MDNFASLRCSKTCFAGTIPSTPQSVRFSEVTNNSDTTVVTLQWDPPTVSFVNNYTITVTPQPLFGVVSPITGNQTTLTLQYNVEYMVTVRGSNCIGSSDAATAIFRIGECIYF